MIWQQYPLTIDARPRGFHLITQPIISAVLDLPSVEIGILHAFILHTSASLTLNENADPDVRVDMETALNHLAPESGLPFVHTCEGPDDMPAHVKASLMGNSLSIPIRQGELVLGTWQGIYLCEHRNHGGRRRLMLTLFGKSSET